MSKFTRHIVLLAMLLLQAYQSFTQPGLYIPVNGKIFFTGDTATIFSDVINGGNLGVSKNAFLNFTGITWQNEPFALLTDDSDNGNGVTGNGGWIRFLSNNHRQQIKGGYNAATKKGPAFSRLLVQNSLGVELAESSVRVQNEITLANGLFYLQDNILVVGNNNPGKINGYDSLNFFVTGNGPGKGMLLREGIKAASGQVVFPVGSKAGSYTPVSIRSKTTVPDDYYVTVFDGVRSAVQSGSLLNDQSVGITWQAGKLLYPGQGEIEITLQHRIAGEGNVFSQNRMHAYISQFTGLAWDTGYPQRAPAPGNLTTGHTLNGSGVNSRMFSNTLSTASWFTKFAAGSDSPQHKTHLAISAWRTGREQVQVQWTTLPEVNVLQFIVQRRLSNENSFTARDTVPSKAVNGFSDKFLSYSINDPNNYTGISYYRLMLEDYNGNITYSEIIPVAGYTGGSGLLLWPNPSQGEFFVGLNGTSAIKAVVIWNNTGQLIHQEPVNGRYILKMHLYLPGTYMVGFISFSGQVLETKKLIITGTY